MWSKLSVITILVATSASALERPVMKWGVPPEGGKAVLRAQPAELTDLLTDRAYDGRYFKVVYGEGETALPTEPSEIAAQSLAIASEALANEPAEGKTPEIIEAKAKQIAAASVDLSVKAATVYDMFSRSRLYYQKILGAPKPQGLGLSASELAEALDQNGIGQATVLRLEMDVAYSETVHFNRKARLANQALTIPGGGRAASAGVKPWGRETWFFKRQKKNDPIAAKTVAAVLGNPALRLQLLEGLLEQDLAGITKNGLTYGELDAKSSLLNIAVSFGLSFGVLPAVSAAVSQIPHPILLDTALLPEISAHEYGHHALSRWLDIWNRTPVVEGYPNFFASKITGLSELGRKVPGANVGYASRSGNSKVTYAPEQEIGTVGATSSLTWAILADIESRLGEAGFSALLQAIPMLARDSTLKRTPEADETGRSDLQSALFTAIESLGTSPLDRLTRARKIAVQSILTGKRKM